MGLIGKAASLVRQSALRVAFGKGSAWEQAFRRQLAGQDDDNFGAGGISLRTDTDYLMAMRRASWVYIAVSCICDNFTRPNWWFEISAGTKKRKEIEIPELTKLLRRPNPYQSGLELFEATIAYLELAGNAYWYLGEVDALSLFRTTKGPAGEMLVDLAADGSPLLKQPDAPLRAGQPKEIWYLRPDLVKPVPGGPGILYDHFIYEPVPGKKYDIPADLMVVFRRFDPISMTDGLGVIEAMRTVLEADLAAEDYNKRFYANSARPDTVLTSDQVLTKEQMDSAAAHWNARFQGRDNAHKTAVLGQGVKPVPYAISPKDMDFLQSRKFSREQILAAFRVPPSKVDIFETGGLGQSNVGEQDKTFWSECMEPLMRRFTASVSFGLVSRWNTDAQLAFEDMTPDDMMQQSQIAGALVERGIWSINDARDLMNKDALPPEVGDIHWVPSSWVPVDLAILSPPAPVLPPESPQGALPPADGQPSTPNEPAQPAATGAQDALPGPLGRKTLPPGKLRDGRSYRKSLPVIERERTQREFRRAAQRDFQEQEVEVMANLGANVLLVNLLGKLRKASPDADQQVTAAGIIAALADWPTIRARFQATMRDKYRAAMQLAGDTALADLGIDEAFDLEAEHVISWMDGYLPRLSASVTDTTIGTLTSLVAVALANESDMATLQTAFRSAFREAKNQRSEGIAVSEATRSLNRGETLAWQQSGIVVGKQWVFGPNPCEDCQDMGDKMVEISEAFYALGDTYTSSDGSEVTVDYADVEEPPLHPWCVCGVVPVLLETEQ